MRLVRLRGIAAAVVALSLALATTGCAGRWAYRQGKAEMKKGNWDMAVARLTKALQQKPDSIEYKLALENAKVQASRHHYTQARKHLAAGDTARRHRQQLHNRHRGHRLAAARLAEDADRLAAVDRDIDAAQRFDRNAR